MHEYIDLDIFEEGRRKLIALLDEAMKHSDLSENELSDFATILDGLTTVDRLTIYC